MAATTSDPNERAALLLHEVRCDAALGRLDDSARVLDEVLKLAPIEPAVEVSVSFVVARVSALRGHHDEARREYEGMLERFADLLATAEYRSFYEEVYLQRAVEVANSHKFEEAIPLAQGGHRSADSHCRRQAGSAPLYGHLLCRNRAKRDGKEGIPAGDLFRSRQRDGSSGATSHSGAVFRVRRVRSGKASTRDNRQRPSSSSCRRFSARRLLSALKSLPLPGRDEERPELCRDSAGLCSLIDEHYLRSGWAIREQAIHSSRVANRSGNRAARLCLRSRPHTAARGFQPALPGARYFNTRHKLEKSSVHTTGAMFGWSHSVSASSSGVMSMTA